MEKEKAIEVLNTLITVNNDRIESYETTSEITEEPELKILFEKLISTSQKCKKELVTEVNSLGGQIVINTMVSEKFFRTWMEVKASLTDNDRKKILSSCEHGEDMTKDAYDEVLRNESKHLSANQQTMIRAQKLLLKADHNHIKVLHDTLVET